MEIHGNSWVDKILFRRIVLIIEMKTTQNDTSGDYKLNVSIMSPWKHNIGIQYQFSLISTLSILLLSRFAHHFELIQRIIINSPGCIYIFAKNVFKPMNFIFYNTPPHLKKNKYKNSLIWYRGRDQRARVIRPTSLNALSPKIEVKQTNRILLQSICIYSFPSPAIATSWNSWSIKSVYLPASLYSSK